MHTHTHTEGEREFQLQDGGGPAGRYGGVGMGRETNSSLVSLFVQATHTYARALISSAIEIGVGTIIIVYVTLQYVNDLPVQLTRLRR